MTIKEFATLCGCNPQTLRYYDHMELLKPSKVDEWSGYRYYDEEQAVLFVEIRNLQKAGFKIEEIKRLLDQGHTAICRAFDEKIAQAEENLREIKMIRSSYQTEMEQIKEKVREMREMIFKSLEHFDPQAEFGVSEEEYQALISTMSSLFDRAENEPDLHKIKMQDDKEKKKDFLSDPNYECIFERHDWQNVKEFFNECCELAGDKGYVLVFRVDEKKNAHRAAIANTAIGTLLNKNPQKERSLGCSVDLSEDGNNHFWLLCRKA